MDRHPKVCIDFEDCDFEVMALVDTGASCSLIGGDLWRELAAKNCVQRCPLGADMQNYIHAFQVSTTSTCIFNDSSAAFITFYRLNRPSRKLRGHEAATLGRRLLLIARAIVDNITRLGCGGSNTNKTVFNSLLELMTVSAQLGFSSWGFNNSMHTSFGAKYYDVLVPPVRDLIREIDHKKR
ncbi:hypothetical protein CAPTEDRAFT_196071 [Capitella teleta]|uniref:Uncharacterized protein n=1 Tax=Capitella teleta TaxID=283909 RepID=R7TTF2_CAPTE|nr:hypothetical protein CAPTEDRAFT_196071 [Capitella teleta]|eukprot:ELT97188.1 hypothetical protein CAPTEDRAFT_196071 [Capitella teleta]